MRLRDWFIHEGLDERALEEHEDPTSSKHDSDDDSKWAGPKSSREGMPHEEPHSPAQQRGADGWEEMRKSSDRAYPGSKSSSALRGFFGDDPYPKPSGRRSSQKVSEGPRLPATLPADWMDAPMGGPAGSSKKSSAASAKMPAKRSSAADAPLGFGGEPPKSSSAADAPWRSLVRASQQEREPEPPGFGDDIIPGDFNDEPRSSKKSRRASVPTGFSMEPDEPRGSGPEEPEGDVSDYYDFPPERRSRQLSPKLKPGVAPDDEEGQALASDPLGAETAQPEEMSWDELRASEPEAAQELERDVDPEELGAARFSKKQDGRLYMDSPAGRRTYAGPEAGWVEMDDGESPAGEF